MTVTVSSTITFPYKRSLGPVLGAFMTALVARRLIGIRSGARVICPPLEWDPETGAELPHEFVEVGPSGTVESWCWIPTPGVAHPLDHPFAFAEIRLDGADTNLIHVVDVGSAEDMSLGLRVVPRWRPERTGHITDIEAFVPGTDAAPPEPAGAAEPVTMMDYHASITYTTPVPQNVTRSEEAVAQGRFLGLRCPQCGRTYTGTRGYCPVDSLALTPEHEVDLPQRGVLTNYTIITPVQYPGQTETEPFARVQVLLEGADVVLGYQRVIEIPVDDIRIGMRLAAVWSSAETNDRASRLGAQRRLVGWMPTGEPDVDDPDLVNRIF